MEKRPEFFTRFNEIQARIHALTLEARAVLREDGFVEFVKANREDDPARLVRIMVDMADSPDRAYVLRRLRDNAGGG